MKEPHCVQDSKFFQTVDEQFLSSVQLEKKLLINSMIWSELRLAWDQNLTLSLEARVQVHTLDQSDDS